MEAQIAEIRLPVAPKLGEIAIPQQVFRSDQEIASGPGNGGTADKRPPFCIKVLRLDCNLAFGPKNDVAPLLRRITKKGAARGQIGGRPFFCWECDSASAGLLRRRRL